MDKLEIYKTWAPDSALWTQWAKPVLFTKEPPKSATRILDVPKLNWISAADYNTMIIVDLPGQASADEAIALAKLGFRPVPLYNGVVGQNRTSGIVDVWDLVKVLYQGADELSLLNIRSDAPPAFILDSNRMRDRQKDLVNMIIVGAFLPRICPLPPFCKNMALKDLLYAQIQCSQIYYIYYLGIRNKV